MRVFPVAAEGRPSFSDDWGAPRSGGRSHQGNDIFAPEGTPLLAVDDGRVFFGTGSLGGNIARLEATDGARYIYSHLVAFEGEERAVKAGEVIGYVGNTGNAAGLPHHVHFEVHPDGGDAVNPFPMLTALRRGEPPLARAAGAAASCSRSDSPALLPLSCFAGGGADL